MTTIVSRLYESAEAASAVVDALAAAEADAGGVAVVTASEGFDTAQRIQGYGVSGHLAAAYAPKVNEGAALVVARCEFAPVGMAKRAMDTMDAAGPMDVGMAKESTYYQSTAKSERFTSVLRGHPLMLTSDRGRRRGLASHAFGIRTLTSWGRRQSTAKWTHVSKWFFPIPLLEKRKKHYSVVSNGALITAPFMPMVSRRMD